MSITLDNELFICHWIKHMRHGDLSLQCYQSLIWYFDLDHSGLNNRSVELATMASACSRARRLSSATDEFRCSCIARNGGHVGREGLEHRQNGIQPGNENILVSTCLMESWKTWCINIVYSEKKYRNCKIWIHLF